MEHQLQESKRLAKILQQYQRTKNLLIKLKARQISDLHGTKVAKMHQNTATGHKHPFAPLTHFIGFRDEAALGFREVAV